MSAENFQAACIWCFSEQDPFVLVEKSDPNQYLPDKYWLLNREKLVLKSIPAGSLPPEFRDFPGSKDFLIRITSESNGIRWHSKEAFSF